MRKSPPDRRRTTTRPRLRPRVGTRGTAPRRNYSSYSIAGSTRFLYGSYHWHGHFSTLLWHAPYCNWGFYAFPFHFHHHGSHFFHHHRHHSFGVYWRSRFPSHFSIWWWPRRCYVPGSYFGFTYFDRYGDDYLDYYVSRPVYREVVYEPARVEVARAAEGGDPVAEADPEPEPADPEAEAARLAERHLNLGDYYFRQGRFEEAAESYLRALTYASDDASIHFVIADALFAQGDYHYAAYMITKAIELDPTIAAADTDKREFYGDPKMFDRQLETLRRYLAEKPYDAAAHLVMGYNLKFSKDLDGAKLAFERVLEIDPKNEPGKVFLVALAGDGPAEEEKKAEPKKPGESTESGKSDESGSGTGK